MLLGSSRESQKKSIFQHSESCGFRLKDSMQFHLYTYISARCPAETSTSIFWPHEPILEGTDTHLPINSAL